MKTKMQKLLIELLEVRALMTGSPGFPGTMPSPTSTGSLLAGDGFDPRRWGDCLRCLGATMELARLRSHRDGLVRMCSGWQLWKMETA
jgi:hypothetical protein